MYSVSRIFTVKFSFTLPLLKTFLLTFTFLFISFTGIRSDSISSSRTCKLVFQITNLPAEEGVLIACLSNNSEKFLKDCDFTSRMDTRGATEVLLVFEEIPTGSYAAAIFLDLNGNRELDKGRLQIPKEPFGFSNNPRLIFGPPSFRKCRFKLMGNLSIPISMKHW